MIYMKNSESLHHIGEWFVPEDMKHIAYRLSYQNRFGGSVGAYTVAQHSVEVAMQLPDYLKLSGLLHDVCEAYIGDVISPVKKQIQGYDELESFYCDVIDRHFKVQTRHPLVKEVDLRILLTEAKAFDMPMEHFDWVGLKPYARTIIKAKPADARAQFMRMYRGLAPC
jgi:hypothetical protein